MDKTSGREDQEATAVATKVNAAAVAPLKIAAAKRTVCGGRRRPKAAARSPEIHTYVHV